MEKLKLDLQKLSVESFQTDLLKNEKGTVKGNVETDTNLVCNTCDVTCYHTCGVETCGWTCFGSTCDVTCYHTCGVETCGKTCFETC